MGWARVDDAFYDHPRTVRIWNRCPAAIGLHVRAIAFCAKQETDGHIKAGNLELLSPLQRDREEQVKVLLEEGAWYANEGDYLIHDYLDYNPSRAELLDKRRKDRERKQVARG